MRSRLYQSGYLVGEMVCWVKKRRNLELYGIFPGPLAFRLPLGELTWKSRLGVLGVVV
jgi:hypothetical protein